MYYGEDRTKSSGQLGMVQSTSDRSAKRQAKSEWPVQEGPAGIRDFLERELPPGKIKQAPYIMDALLKAGARYDRYTANRKAWLDYTRRRQRLERANQSAVELAIRLNELDILSRDELASRVDPKEIEALIGSLFFLSKETADLVKHVQKNGRPRDLAEERWILEVADINENFFSKPARVWGSGAEPVKRRGRFYELLNVSRPLSFPRHGKLSLRQIDRTLRQRRERKMTLQPIAI
jgi:hypothetical protein